VASDSWPSRSCTVRASIPGLSPRGASEWRRYRGSDGGAILSGRVPRGPEAVLEVALRGRKDQGAVGHVRRSISATSLENGTVRSSQSFGKNAYCGFARTWTRRCARSRSSGASGVRRGGVQSRALRRRTPAPGRRTWQRISAIPCPRRRRVTCEIWVGAAAPF
jgi:hypothetical protein